MSCHLSSVSCSLRFTLWWFSLPPTLLYMDTNNREKRMIRMKMRHVFTSSTEKFHSTQKGWFVLIPVCYTSHFLLYSHLYCRQPLFRQAANIKVGEEYLETCGNNSVYNTGRCAASSSVVSGKFDNSACQNNLLWLKAWCMYTHVMIRSPHLASLSTVKLESLVRVIWIGLKIFGTCKHSLCWHMVGYGWVLVLLWASLKCRW